MSRTELSKKKLSEHALEKKRRQELIRNAIIGVVALFLVGGAIYYVADQTIKGEKDKLRPDANPAEQNIAVEGAGHVEEGAPLSYAHFPPSSGSHYPRPWPAGYYDQPVAEGYWIHSLEHGFVVVLYNCPDGCPDMQAKLQSLMSKAPPRRCDERRLIIVPYSRGMTTPISMVAWGKQLDLAEYDEQAILNFYKRYEDRGPEQLPCR